MADDGLEWTLKLKAEVEGATKMVRALTDTMAHLKDTATATKHVDDATKHAGTSHRKHAEDAKHLEGALNRLVHAGMEPFLNRAKEIAEFEFIRRGVDAILDAPEKLIEKVRELGSELLLTAGKAEESKLVLGALFGKEAAEDIDSYSEKLGKVTQATDDQIKEMSRSLGNAGFKPGKDLERGLRASLDLGALSGNGAAGAKEAAAMLERLQNMGEVNPKMLNAFGIGQDSFWKELSKRTGTGIATLRKQMEAGKVDIDATKDAIYTVITKKTHQGLGGFAADLGQDFNSKLKNLRDLPDQYFQKFADSPAFDVVKQKMDQIFNALDPTTPRGKKIFDSFESAVTMVVDAVSHIDFEKVATTLEKEIIPALGQIVSLVKPLIDFTTSGIHALNAAGDAVAQPFTDTILQAQNMVDTFSHPIDSLRDYFRTIGGHTGNGMVEGMKKTKPAVVAATNETMDATVGAARKTLGVQSPSKVFEHLGAMSAAGYSKGLARGEDSIRAATVTAVAPPTRAPSSGIDIGGVTVNISVAGVPGESVDDLVQRIATVIPEKVRAAVLSGTGGRNGGSS